MIRKLEREKEIEEEGEEENEEKKESFCCYFSCEYELSKSQLTMAQGDFFSRQTETKKKLSCFLLFQIWAASDLHLLCVSDTGGRNSQVIASSPHELKRYREWKDGFEARNTSERFHWIKWSQDRAFYWPRSATSWPSQLSMINFFAIDLVFNTQSGSFTRTLGKDCVYWHRMLNKIPDPPNSAIYVCQLHRYFNWSL